MLILDLTPHIERDGTHTDRFDAHLDGQHIVTSRQPIYAGARALLDLGHDPVTPMCGRWQSNGTKTMFGTVGEHAKWTVYESSAGGLRKRPWKPFEIDATVAR